MKSKASTSKTAYLLFSVIGILFCFCFLTEADLAGNGNIIWTISYCIKTAAISLAVGIPGGILLCRVLHHFVYAGYPRSKQPAEAEALPSSGTAAKPENRLRLFFEKMTAGQFFSGSLILILLAWLPCYLAFYPGICAYDSYIQVGQIESGSYIDHHPIAHTLLIRGAMKLGKIMTGNVTAGIGLYTFLQLLFLGTVFAWGITFLRKHGFGIAGLLLMQAVCMFYPFHWYMSVSVTKDIIFTGFFLLQILSLSELVLETEYKKTFPILFFVSTTGMIVFRNNGQYACMVLLVFLALTALFGREHKRFGKLFLLVLSGLISGILLLNLLFHITGAEQGDRRELLSMPIQQLARVMVYHGGVGVLPKDDNTLTDSEKALINDFILDEAYRDYDPHISDPVKRHTNTYVARYRMKEFIHIYLELLIKYPGDFLNAALETNAGYLYPGDTSHAYINVSELNSGLGYVQTRWEESTLNSAGIYKASKSEALHTLLKRWADENGYLKIPIFKYLFMPGIWLWLYLLLIGSLFVIRQRRLCLPLVLVLGYYLTLFLGPTVQLRYIYPVMAAYPFMLLFCIKTGLHGK
ncbi:MAG: DUF6020 family protein [Firmicutes bacterium]|nr:DUF6020 family protein [Bacillota bacterium]